MKTKHPIWLHKSVEFIFQYKLTDQTDPRLPGEVILRGLKEG